MSNITSSNRDWREYNKRQIELGRIEVYINKSSVSGWLYSGTRKRGGVVTYSDSSIELCLIIKELYGFSLRAAQGFMSSLLALSGFKGLSVPNYSTISRRCGKLEINILPKARKLLRTGGVIAIDSTGLSVHSHDAWNKHKHEKSHKWQDKWRKLHIFIDSSTGVILSASYSKSNVNDCSELPNLLKEARDRMEKEGAKIRAIAGDMAYDTLGCRKAIKDCGAHQLIPPKRNAIISKNNKNHKNRYYDSMKISDILKERDDAINFFEYNQINGDKSKPRARWKELIGYHQRSKVETTMSQIKAYSSDRLSMVNEDNRKSQALIKAKIVNIRALYL